MPVFGGKEPVTVEHPTLPWKARHNPVLMGGPEQLEVNGDLLLQDAGVYIDDMEARSAAVEDLSVSRDKNCMVVDQTGFLPFGEELAWRQMFRYGANHVRCTADFYWPQNFEIQRHFGVDTLFLPGKWESFYCVPPVQHSAEGVSPFVRPIPEVNSTNTEGIMAGHWHRPPLAIVFRRQDGTEIEVGTGDDVWRWESSLEYGPESGSYKIIAKPDGIRFLREPLMCCHPFTPTPKTYRFTWYIAWSIPEHKEPDVKRSSTANQTSSDIPDDDSEANSAKAAITFDISLLQVDPGGMRELNFAATEIPAEPQPCWMANATQKAARRYIRRIAEQQDTGHLTLKNFFPGVCNRSSHPRNPADEGRGITHWDLPKFLDFCIWAHQRLGQSWQLKPEPSWGLALPSLRGVGVPPGFGPI